MSLGLLGDGGDTSIVVNLPEGTTARRHQQRARGRISRALRPHRRCRGPGVEVTHPASAAAPDRCRHVLHRRTARVAAPATRRRAASLDRGPRRAGFGAGRSGQRRAGARGWGSWWRGSRPASASPVEAVARQVIRQVPTPVERFAIETFGPQRQARPGRRARSPSRPSSAPCSGVLARRRPWARPSGMAGFALLGALASVAAPNAHCSPPRFRAWRPERRAPLSLRLLVPRPDAARVPDVAGIPLPAARGGPRGWAQPGPAGRSWAWPPAVTAAAALAGAGGRALRSRFSAAESRADVSLPRPARPLPPVPAGRRGRRARASPPSSPPTPTSTASTPPWSCPRSGPRTGRSPSAAWSTSRSSSASTSCWTATWSRPTSRSPASPTRSAASWSATPAGSGCRCATCWTGPGPAGAPTNSSGARSTATPAASPCPRPTTGPAWWPSA